MIDEMPMVLYLCHMPTIPTLLVTTVQAAEISGKNWRTIIRLVERGQLKPAQKLPGLRGAFLFNRSDIEALAGSDAVQGKASA